MTSAKLVLLALALIVPAGSQAALMSARDLLTACSGDGIAKATCDGYLMAATDLILRRESSGRTGAKLCVPANVTVDQVREAVLNAGQHSRAANAPAGLGLVVAAMRGTWPCEAAPRDPGAAKTQ